MTASSRHPHRRGAGVRCEPHFIAAPAPRGLVPRKRPHTDTRVLTRLRRWSPRLTHVAAARPRELVAGRGGPRAGRCRTAAGAILVQVSERRRRRDHAARVGAVVAAVDRAAQPRALHVELPSAALKSDPEARLGPGACAPGPMSRRDPPTEVGGSLVTDQSPGVVLTVILAMPTSRSSVTASVWKVSLSRPAATGEMLTSVPSSVAVPLPASSGFNVLPFSVKM